jgi:hypothetical protein
VGGGPNRILRTENSKNTVADYRHKNYLVPTTPPLPPGVDHAQSRPRPAPITPRPPKNFDWGTKNPRSAPVSRWSSGKKTATCCPCAAPAMFGQRGQLPQWLRCPCQKATIVYNKNRIRVVYEMGTKWHSTKNMDWTHGLDPKLDSKLDPKLDSSEYRALI